MRKYLFIPVVFFHVAIFAQNGEVFKIDSLPKQGVLLDKGWRCKVGDNPEFANADLDDADWKTINPTLDIFSLPQIPKTGEIVWLRLHLSVDSSLNRQLVMMIVQSGASEIFLNGKLIHHFGVLSSKPAEIKAFNPNQEPVSFPVQKTLNQVLAVRYALQPHIFYTTIFQNLTTGLSIEINSTENGIEKLSGIWDYNSHLYSAFIGIGIVFLFSFLHFLFIFSGQKSQPVFFY